MRDPCENLKVRTQVVVCVAELGAIIAGDQGAGMYAVALFQISPSSALVASRRVTQLNWLYKYSAIFFFFFFFSYYTYTHTHTPHTHTR